MSRLAALGLVGLALLAGACGGSAAAQTTTAPSTTAAAAGPPAASSIDRTFDFGQEVLITATRVRPAWLVSTVGRPLVWWNESGRPQQIVFDHQAKRSPVIPPGGSYRVVFPTALSVTYHSVSGLHGKVQVTPSGQ